MKLHTKILIGLLAGSAAGLILSHAGLGAWGGFFQPFGDAFVNLIRMVVLPLVMASIIVGIAGMGDLRKLGRISAKTLLYFAVSTITAVVFGLVMATVVPPGAGIDEEQREAIIAEVGGDKASQGRIEEAAARGRNIGDILFAMIPSNPFQAMAEGQLLPVIVFSILFGIALNAAGGKGRIVEVLEEVNDVMVALVNMIMKLAPYGVTAIALAVTARLGASFLLSLINYTLLTVFSLVVFFFVFYGASVRLLAGMSPIYFFKAMRPVALLAFATSSSNATLPENMLVCRRDLGAPRDVVAFALPLGATINMDGSAIYQGISAVFIAQVFGMHLDLGQMLTIVLTASLASVAAAGVPGMGVVTLAIVLSSVGLPETGLAIVLGVERLVDMFRTVLNVTGDAAAAVIVGKSEGGLKPTVD